MQITLLTNSIDKQLSNAIQTAGTSGSEFHWYLALLVDDITHYHAKNNELIENELPYPSIDLPSTPKVSLYAKEQHYQQCVRQAESIHSSKQPVLQIQLANCLLPQSLHWAKEEQIFSQDIIENCPAHVQKAFMDHKTNSEPYAVSTENQLLQGAHKSETILDSQLNSTKPNSDFFVDTIFENASMANEITF